MPSKTAKKPAAATVLILGGSPLAGTTMPLFMPAEDGETKCPGDAHSNPYIDNCMICLSNRWGFVRTYARVNVLEATSNGFAVAVNDTDHRTSPEHRATIDNLEKSGAIRMVMVERKIGKRSASSFFAYIKA